MVLALKKCNQNCNKYDVIITNSYALMLSCWSECPSDRPAFTEITNTVTALIKPLARYMDFSEMF